MILREAFGKMIDFINSKIDKPEAKITYIPWDFKKASKKYVPYSILPSPIIASRILMLCF
jgi:hypothetical protein